MKNKKKLASYLGILGVLFITLGLSYAFFTYSKLGRRENSIETGTIKFIYNESLGNGISLTDAMPMTDEEGKKQDKYFDFSIKGTTNNEMVIPYEMTVRKTDDSDDIGNYVKLYLTNNTGAIELDKTLSLYSDLSNSTNEIASVNHEKTLYKSSVAKNKTDYVEKYRLRMWLSDNINLNQTIIGSCSDNIYTTKETCEEANKDWTEIATNESKTFKIKVNVYSQVKNIADLGPGLYDDDYKQVYTWQELMDGGYFRIIDGILYREYNANPADIDGTLVIDDKISNIGGGTFAGYPNLRNVIIPEGVTTISSNVFAGSTNLEHVYLPSTLTTIEQSSFNSCFSLTDIDLPSGLVTIEDYAFGYSNINEIILPDSVTRVGAYAFSNCNNLEKINMGNGTMNMDRGVFSRDSNLKEITLSNNLTMLGSWDFEHCSSLESITLPNSITYIPRESFNNCTSLEEINIPSTITSIENRAFAGTPWLDAKKQENPMVVVNDILVDWQAATGDVVIPDGIKSIGGTAFYNNKNVTSVTIPNSVTRIEQYAFSATSNLTGITFNNPNNWNVRTCGVYGTPYLYGTPIDINSNDLSDPASAVTLKNTYNDYIWTRSD